MSIFSWIRSIYISIYLHASASLFQLYLILCDLWTVARQSPLSMGLCRQEYWSGWPRPSSRGSSRPSDWTKSPTLQADSLPSELPGKPIYLHAYTQISLAVMSNTTLTILNKLFLYLKIHRHLFLSINIQLQSNLEWLHTFPLYVIFYSNDPQIKIWRLF